MPKNPYMVGLVALAVAIAAFGGVALAEARQWTAQVVDSAGDVGQFASIALDVAGTPHISYYDQANEDLKHTVWTGTEWHTETVDEAGYVGDYTSLEVDSRGLARISYHDSLNHSARYATETETGWEVATIPDTGFTGLYTSLALDQDDRAHVVYQRYSWPQALRYASQAETGWVSETIEAGNVGQYASLTIGSGSQPWVSYFDETNGDLKVATRTANGWQVDTVDTAGVVGELYSSIAVDLDGYPHVTYYDTTQGLLKHAVLSDTGWSVEIIDAEGNVGPYSSLSFDATGIPHVSYYDNSLADLKYATWVEGQWVTTTVDQEGRVGLYTSLQTDNLGRVHIAYYDVSQGDLRYASGIVQTAMPPAAINLVLDAKPDTLNLSSHRDRLTIYVESAPGVDLADIDMTSVSLEVAGVAIQSDQLPRTLGDYDGDGNPDLMLKFAAQELTANLSEGLFDFTLRGQTTGGTAFVGADPVKVIGGPAELRADKTKKGS